MVHEPNESRQHRRPHISHIWYTKSVSRNLNERPVFGTMLPDHGLPISGSLFTSGKRAALHVPELDKKTRSYVEKFCNPSISGTAFSISSCYGYPRGEVITDITKTTRVHVHECALVALVQRHGTYLGQVLVLFKHTGITKPRGDQKERERKGLVLLSILEYKGNSLPQRFIF